MSISFRIRFMCHICKAGKFPFCITSNVNTNLLHTYLPVLIYVIVFRCHIYTHDHIYICKYLYSYGSSMPHKQSLNVSEVGKVNKADFFFIRFIEIKQ